MLEVLDLWCLWSERFSQALENLGNDSLSCDECLVCYQILILVISNCVGVSAGEKWRGWSKSLVDVGYTELVLFFRKYKLCEVL